MKKSLIVLILIAFFGCSSDSNNDSQSIIGIWEAQNCIQIDHGNDQFYYVLPYYELNADLTFYREFKIYYSQNCDSEDYSLVTDDGTYSIGEKIVVSSGESATRLDLTFPCPTDEIDCSPITINLVYNVDGDILIFGDLVEDEYVLHPENIFIRID